MKLQPREPNDIAPELNELLVRRLWFLPPDEPPIAKAANLWPCGLTPQGFLLLPTTAVGRKQLAFRD